MKILITGSNGLLGQKLVYELRQLDTVSCVATARGENRIRERSGYIYESLDLTDPHRVAQVIQQHRPDCIIHTAAMTNVDACELDPEACQKNNVDAVKHFIIASRVNSSKIILYVRNFILMHYFSIIKIC